MFTTIDIDKAATLFKALGNKTRLTMFTRIFSVRRCQTFDLISNLSVSKATAHEHLRSLERAGLIKRSRKGNTVHCQINYKSYEILRTYFEEARKEKRWQEKLMGFQYLGDWNEDAEENVYRIWDWENS